MNRARDQEPNPHQRRALLISALLVAASGLGYELVGGAVSTYLQGDGVLQFCIVIGTFLSAMGIGSLLSRTVHNRFLPTLVWLEISVAVLGSVLAPTLTWVYGQGGPYTLTLVSIVGAVGVLTGMEIPLLLRLLERGSTLREAAASVLGLDYIGALIASLAVPIVLIPSVGTIGAGCVFGLLNLAVAGVVIASFPRLRTGLMIGTVTVLSLPMIAGVAFSDRIAIGLEEELYQDPVVYSHSSRHQRIVLTQWRGDLRLFLNGSLQFSSRDEYRYHEALVHPVMAHAERRDHVLVLGGGDGLAVRELLRWPGVQTIDLVDLDGDVLDMASKHPALLALNEGSLKDPRVRLHASDALRFLQAAKGKRWDVIVMDLPDPSTPELSRLYARSSLRLIARHLAPDGALVTQATSPFFARRAFWCIVDSIAASKPAVPVGLD